MLQTNGVEFRRVSYGPPHRAKILDGLSLTVGAGETLALVGGSGAGKTTVLKLINRLLLPEAGEILVQGIDTREWDPIRLRRSVGYVIQEVGLFPHLNVADNIAVVPRLEAWPDDRVAARVHELLDLIGLAPDTYASRWPDELSGGERQRVGVARALRPTAGAADGRTVRLPRSDHPPATAGGVPPHPGPSRQVRDPRDA